MFGKKIIKEQDEIIDQLRQQIRQLQNKCKTLEEDKKNLKDQITELVKLNHQLIADINGLKKNQTDVKPDIQYTTKTYNGFSLTEEQSRVVDLLENTNENYFITGKAGSGKSTILSYFKATTKKKNIVITAFTGAAAINVGGQTIHSLFRMNFAPQNTEKKSDVENFNKEIIKAIEVLIIDEVSMVRSDIMDMIDHRLQCAKGNTKPFGGCQVILFGDLYQLPPITSAKEEYDFLIERYGTLFFFGAPNIKHFKKIVLNDVLRQNDNKFINILNSIRNGEASNETLRIINNNCYKIAPKEWLHLTLRKDVAKNINLLRLAEIQNIEYQFNVELGGNEPPSQEDVPFDFTLRVKVGAKIMMLKNDPAHQYFNGSMGTVKKIEDNIIIVEIGGKEYPVEKAVWEKKKYKRISKNELSDETVGWAKQYPIKLAYAITIHKAQGQTYDNVVIDYTDGNAFTCGQTYVALSRCRTLEGIRLTRPITKEDILVSKEVVEYLKDFENIVT